MSQGSEGVNALRCQWPKGLLYAFPPLPLILAVIRKTLQQKAEILLVAPYWPRRPWFEDLVSLSVSCLWRIPPERVYLSQSSIQHLEPQWLQLTAWHLRGDCYKKVDLPTQIINTIQADRRQSTIRIYETTWRVFCNWFKDKGSDPGEASISQVLDFL
uniref:Uncharacterized protein n=1 Tax=Micrurus lemniscatus lemniscatus TaxID=129467 RepID=A0A2D4HVC6_MICLE